MEFTHFLEPAKRKKADLLVLPFVEGTKAAEALFPLSKESESMVATPLETRDFKGKEGEFLMLYTPKEPEKRCFLLGLGKKEKVDAEVLRKSYGGLVKHLISKGMSHVNVQVPHIDHLSDKKVLKGVVEGMLLPNYRFNSLKGESKKEEEKLIETIGLISSQKDVLSESEKIFKICNAVDYARDLVNGNADDVTPEHLVLCAKGLEKEYAGEIKVTVFDKKRLEKEEMGLLLAVGRGSHVDPALIFIEYKGNPSSKDHVVIVGKGVTYDTGGLNLKPTGSMETMKCDMGGAAACFGTMVAAVDIGLKVNLTAVIPTTENAIDAKSFKPGDVYKSYSGTTVEMTNSDAEGRLILADALSYSVKKLKPSCLIDLATLTGAIEIALGPEASGLMSNNDKLAKAIEEAGEETYERVWRMPLYEEYKAKLKSDIADIKSWNGRSASSNVAAMFLEHFVEKTPWAHLDIAGTAYLQEPKKYQPKYATGVGVRLLVEFLEKRKEHKA